MAEASDGLQDAGEALTHGLQGRPVAAAGSMFKRFMNSETRGLTEAQADAIAPMLTARGTELAKVLGELKQYGGKSAGRQALRSAGVRATSQAAGAPQGDHGRDLQYVSIGRRPSSGRSPVAHHAFQPHGWPCAPSLARPSVYSREAAKLMPYDEGGDDDGQGYPDHVMTLPLTPPRW
jgi:hypothetical protein